MFFDLIVVLIRLADELLAVIVAVLWALIVLAAIIGVIYKVETSRRLDKRGNSKA